MIGQSPHPFVALVSFHTRLVVHTALHDCNDRGKKAFQKNVFWFSEHCRAALGKATLMGLLPDEKLVLYLSYFWNF